MLSAEAERLALEWDRYLERLPRCRICDDPIPPGSRYRKTRGMAVCESCMWELEQGEEISGEVWI